MRTLIYLLTIVGTSAGSFFIALKLLPTNPALAVVSLGLMLLFVIAGFSYYESRHRIDAHNESRKLDMIENGTLTDENVDQSVLDKK